MKRYDPNIYHRQSLRLSDFDYASDVGAPLAAPKGLSSTTRQSAMVNHGDDTKRGAASSASTLGMIMRAFKSISAIAVNRLLDRTGQPLWQRNYFERIIRNDNELRRLREYVVGNPRRWGDADSDDVGVGALIAAPRMG